VQQDTIIPVELHGMNMLAVKQTRNSGDAQLIPFKGQEQPCSGLTSAGLVT
jgi:hypothetical protein